MFWILPAKLHDITSQKTVIRPLRGLYYMWISATVFSQGVKIICKGNLYFGVGNNDSKGILYCLQIKGGVNCV
jgi:hypothetical protein